MSAQLLEGKGVALRIKEQLKKEIESLKNRYGAAPKLISIQAGENQASEIYIKSQEKCARELGIDYDAMDFLILIYAAYYLYKFILADIFL